jgi:hypothetical protein
MESELHIQHDFLAVVQLHYKSEYVNRKNKAEEKKAF